MPSSAIQPADEPGRMSAVRRYDILDTPPDGSFDRITAIAARRFGVPIAIISIVDHDRIWFKSHHGLDVEQIGRDPGLCASAILSDDPYLLPDASIDIRSLANPLVAGDFGLRFYAGVPLHTHDGHNLGTLCVIDRAPRQIDPQHVADLQDLASVVMDQLELRLSATRAMQDARHLEIMAREIDHRVMNSLQFISTMLRAQAREAADQQLAAHLGQAGARVLAVARAHNHLHIHGPSRRIGCLEYLKRLCTDLGAILPNPIDVQGIEALIPTQQIQLIGLAVNELVTNAAKYAAGPIAVRLEPGEPGHYRLSVRNEGAIMPAGFDPRDSPSGLGMTLVQTLARQLNGKLDIGPNPTGGGLSFTIAFPAV